VLTLLHGFIHHEQTAELLRGASAGGNAFPKLHERVGHRPSKVTYNSHPELSPQWLEHLTCKLHFACILHGHHKLKLLAPFRYTILWLTSSKELLSKSCNRPKKKKKNTVRAKNWVDFRHC
jgi:hypothetical protein